MINIWRWFMSFCCCKKKLSGEIVLGFGAHQIEIDIPGTPCRVYFDIEDPVDGCCVCHGQANKIGITMSGNGFVILADINTNSCLIGWRCEYR